ncbi:MAG: hypothetical protein KGI08_10970 [Thaumarchaeota archaeon]|nr:hypothetical protein [Nitrososphaerota archaeon]
MVRLGLDNGKRVEESLITFRVEREKELALSKEVKVGCVIEGWKKAKAGTIYETYEYFGSANIEISSSFVYHAEMIALTDCIMHRFYPIRIFVSSQSKEENVLLCGSCRQLLLEVNSDCEVIVLNPDGTRKHNETITVHDTIPNHKDVIDKNQKFLELLS